MTLSFRTKNSLCTAAKPDCISRTCHQNVSALKLNRAILHILEIMEEIDGKGSESRLVILFYFSRPSNLRSQKEVSRMYDLTQLRAPNIHHLWMEVLLTEEHSYGPAVDGAGEPQQLKQSSDNLPSIEKRSFGCQLHMPNFKNKVQYELPLLFKQKQLPV